MRKDLWVVSALRDTLKKKKEEDENEEKSEQFKDPNCEGIFLSFRIIINFNI